MEPLEEDPSYEHAVDQRVRIRVGRRDLQRTVADTSTAIVKALSKRAPVPLGLSIENLMGNFWVIVNRVISGNPSAFILTPAEVQQRAHRGERDGRVSYWLQPRDYDLPDFMEKWDRIIAG